MLLLPVWGRGKAMTFNDFLVVIMFVLFVIALIMTLRFVREIIVLLIKLEVESERDNEQ